jgi:hypothetical protein
MDPVEVPAVMVMGAKEVIVVEISFGKIGGTI